MEGIMIIIIIALFIAYRKGLFDPAPPEPEDPKEVTRRLTEEFNDFKNSQAAAQLDALFKEYPEVEYWAGTDCSHISINHKKKGYVFGHAVIEDTQIVGWESSDGKMIFERVNRSLEEQVKIDKIEAMLKDNDKIRKYCDLVAEQLLEDDTQAFNALEGLGCRQQRFDAEYYDESWIKAWETALLHEFSAKRVEYKGEGVFWLEAI